MKSDSSSAFATAAARNGKSTNVFARAAQDYTMWLDTCGKAFFVDPVPQSGSAAPIADLGEGDPSLPGNLDAFNLNSAPGSSRTIYLDFDGATVSGTAWNNMEGMPSMIDAPAFAFGEPDDVFSDSERDAIYHAWLVVSEDYAPFDVNVTTKDPGFEAIDRTSGSDLIYGTRVVVSNEASFDWCSCGGMGYLGVFGTSGSDHAYFQPAWAFATSGWNTGQAITHEVGHNFGLSHDTDTIGGYDYYIGTPEWSPIMGVSDASQVSQWSLGDYPGGGNHEDDLAIIATNALLRADDFGGTAAAATTVDNYAPINGRITTRDDVDTFTFSAAGPTTFSATTLPDDSDVDLSLRIVNANGTTVANIHPATPEDGARPTHPVATEQSAVWTADLPSTFATYTAFVDGIGTGNPATAGNYSDYASLGQYKLSLTTDVADGLPPRLTAPAPEAWTIRTDAPVDQTVFEATGGTAPYTWSAAGLPDPLKIDYWTGRVTGTTPDEYPSWAPLVFTVTATDARGASVSGRVTFNLIEPEKVTIGGRAFNFTVTKAVDERLRTTGERSNPVWTARTSLPPGLRLSKAGQLTGTPTEAGDFSFTVQAKTEESMVSAVLTASIVPMPARPTIVTKTLRDARVGKAYSSRISAEAGRTGLTWSMVGGVFPKGLKLVPTANGGAALLKGTPKKAGTYKIQFQAVDGDSLPGLRWITLRVR